MKNWHNEKFIINDTNLDYSEHVPVNELLKFFQIATFNHSNFMGLDHESMIEKSSAFWVVTKMKLVVNDNIYSGDKLSVTTWTHELGGVRALRDCVMKVGHSLKVKGRSEWCCLDFETRKLRKMSSIHYPNLSMEKTNNLKIDFSNPKIDVNENDLAYSRMIHSTDVDLNNHTNNLKYNLIALDALSLNELNSIIIKEYEIYFVNESYEGEKIDVYKKRVKDYYYIEGKNQDRTIFKVEIKFKNKKER